MHILVTGGAGYIGSHTVDVLLEKGFKVTVLDNLTTGFREAVPAEAELVVGDVRDHELLIRIFSQNKFSAVVHFAAKLIVPESIEQPLEYYENNIGGVLSLINACRIAKVDKIVFSSTAAVYGEAFDNVDEAAPLRPMNPYGKSKLMAEEILKDAENAYGLRCARLRYFNVAGAKAGGGNGQRTKDATHLLKVVSEAASGKRGEVNIYGEDYPTADGTCVRDYIHVDDLAELHVLALEYLLKGGKGDVFNCGYGKGYSVKEVIGTMQKISGLNFKVTGEGRREGDAVQLVANSEKIKKTFGWQPKFNDLNFICKSAYDWERSFS